MSLVALRFAAVGLEDFRRWERLARSFPERGCWLVGANGAGKTTILEALHLVARARPLRRGRGLPLVRLGAAAFRVRARALRFGPLELEARGGASGVSFLLQGSPVRARAELRELAPVVADSPHGPDLVQGADAERRRWLDAMLVHFAPAAARARANYLRALLQRARARRRNRSGEARAWDGILVEEGWRWHRGRWELAEILDAALAEEDAWAGAVRLRVPEEDEKTFRDRMMQALEGGDALAYGPHVAAIRVERDGRDARLAASRGQQRLCAIALRLAECRAWMDRRASIPALLLDDAAEALDAKRREALVERLLAYPGQVIATAQESPSPQVTVHEIEEEG